MASIGQVWDRTTGYLGDHLSRLMPVAVAGMFVPMVVINVIALLWSTATPGSRQVLAILFFALYLLFFWGYLSMTAVSLDLARGRGAWGLSGRRLPLGIGLYLLLIVAVVILSLPIGVLMAMAGITPEAMRTGAAGAVTVSRTMAWTSLIYLIAFCVVVIVALARLMPLGGVLVAERRGIGSIGRAWRLSRGMTWRLIGVMILYLVVTQVAGLAAQTVFGSVLRLLVGGEGVLTVAGVVTGIVVAAVQTGFTVIGTVFAAKLYEVQAGADGERPSATDGDAVRP